MNHAAADLDPVPGDWAVVRGPGPFLRCQFDVGYVRRCENGKVSFQNMPLGHPSNRIGNVVAVRSTRQDAEVVADAMRHVQMLYEDERQQTTARFLQRMHEMGVLDDDAEMPGRGDYQARSPHRHRENSPFAALKELAGR